MQSILENLKFAIVLKNFNHDFRERHGDVYMLVGSAQSFVIYFAPSRQVVLSYGYYGNSDITAAKFSPGVNPEMVRGPTAKNLLPQNPQKPEKKLYV